MPIQGPIYSQYRVEYEGYDMHSRYWAGRWFDSLVEARKEFNLHKIADLLSFKMYEGYTFIESKG